MSKKMDNYRVRRQKYIHSDDPRYKSGNGVENRIEPPPESDADDAFDRQRCIIGWNQASIEGSKCLILGAGGIGQNVGLVLARLGVGKITFIDKDIYEASNLSRQLLGSVNDIGKRKVDVAVQNISFHALKADAVYVGHHLNALESWPSIVALASDSTVIFNCIDDSSSFDFAVNSLSKSVGIPLVQGQSAAWSYNAEFYSGVYNERCFACSENMKSSFCTESSSYNAIEKRMHDWLGSEESEDCSETRRVLRDWIQDRSTCNSAPGHTESSVIASALFEFLNQDIQFRISGEIARWIVECAAQRVLDGTGYSVEKDSSTNSLVLTKFRRFLQHYYDISMDLLMPGAVDYLTDLLFLPRPKGLPTRYFGSWVCPCLAVANMMVAQFANSVTGPTSRDPPTSIQFSLASGRSDLCEAALECGFVERPSQSTDSSDANCRVCRVATAEAANMSTNGLSAAEQLFFSMSPVALYSHCGRALMSTNPSEIECKSHDASSTDSGSGRVGVVEVRDGRYWYNIDRLGSKYQDLALDAVPCKDICINYTEVQDSNSPSEAWPYGLQTPLIKGKLSRKLESIVKGELGFTRAFSSGARSALLPATGSSANRKWYRLKGCGMLDRGIVIEDVLDDEGKLVVSEGEKPLRKLRGVSYPHTSDIELHMTAKIADLLQHCGRGMITANVPLGRWDYGCPCPCSGICECEYPVVTRSCALFETYGDRRLGDHLLRGLEMLLPIIVSASDSRRLSTFILNQLEEMHSPPDSSSSSSSSGADVRSRNVEEWDEFDAFLPRSILLFNGGASTSPNLLLNMLEASVYDSPSLVMQDADERLDTLKDHFPSNAARELRSTWNTCCDQLAAYCTDGNSIIKLLALVFWRLGRECGTFGRILHENGIIWGSFRDATGGHMNAHANNFVVLPEHIAADRSFLAPLDFDMSFTRETRSVLIDDTIFEELIAQEFSELGFNLAVVHSTCQSTSTGTQAPVAIPVDWSLLRMAMRSTLTRGWLTAAQGLPDEYACHVHQKGSKLEGTEGLSTGSGDNFNSDLSREILDSIHALFKLALILTVDVVA